MRRPPWLAGLIPVVVLAAAIGLFVALDAPGLDRIGVPQEELAVERTVLKPGEIELHLRNDGADPVRIEQAIVNDGFTSFSQTNEEIGRLGGGEVKIDYPWIEGQSYEVMLLTSTGATIDHAIDAAVETPGRRPRLLRPDGPDRALRRRDPGRDRHALAALAAHASTPAGSASCSPSPSACSAFLAHRGAARGHGARGRGPGGASGARPWSGSGRRPPTWRSSGVDAWLRGRAERARRDEPGWTRPAPASARPCSSRSASGCTTSARDSRSARPTRSGRSRSGAALVVGFALHNTTEGLAIVAPVARSGIARLRTLVLLGLLAGAPAVLGAWIGASFFHPSVAAVMFGIGAGAIAQVVVQIAPSIRGADGRLLNPLSAGGLATGLLVMYATGLLVSV